jgi:hypothetical protein
MRFWPVFLIDFWRNPCSWVKNGGWYGNLRCLGNVSKYKTPKNEGKRGRNEQKFIKMRAFLAKIRKN